jgi:hypothetical protein
VAAPWEAAKVGGHEKCGPADYAQHRAEDFVYTARVQTVEHGAGQ